MSRFDVKHSDQELLAVVRAVTRHISPDDPETVSQAAYDSGRAAAGYAGTPRAYRIAKRLSSTWEQVLHLAHIAGNPDHIVGARARTRVRNVLTKAEITHYLQTAAAAVGTTELGTRDYENHRDTVVEADNRRYRHRQGLEELMPTAQMIVSFAGTWENALAWAGLQAKVGAKDPFYPAENALDDFIADHGFAPTLKMLLAYQRKRGLVTTRIPNGYRAWRDNELAHGLASRHAKVTAITHVAQAPDGWDRVTASPAPDGYLKLKPDRYTLDDCERDIETALDLVKGRRLTQDLYQRLAKTHDLAAMSSIQKIGKPHGLTWGQIRDRVIARRARTARKQPRKR